MWNPTKIMIVIRYIHNDNDKVSFDWQNFWNVVRRSWFSYIHWYGSKIFSAVQRPHLVVYSGPPDTDTKSFLLVSTDCSDRSEAAGENRYHHVDKGKQLMGWIRNFLFFSEIFQKILEFFEVFLRERSLLRKNIFKSGRCGEKFLNKRNTGHIN